MSKCCDVYFGLARQKRFNRNKVDGSGCWLGEATITEVEFKLV
jgi:hypothetical protein